MATITIVKGENMVLRRNMTLDDGTTPLNITTLTLKKVEIWQNNALIKSYVFGVDATLRQGATVYQLELEILRTVSDLFKAGLLKIYWIIERPNAPFTVDVVQKDIIIEDALVRVVT